MCKYCPFIQTKPIRPRDNSLERMGLFYFDVNRAFTRLTPPNSNRRRGRMAIHSLAYNVYHPAWQECHFLLRLNAVTTAKTWSLRIPASILHWLSPQHVYTSPSQQTILCSTNIPLSLRYSGISPTQILNKIGQAQPQARSANEFLCPRTRWQSVILF